MAGCASYIPDVHQNEKYQEALKSGQFEIDKSECQALTEQKYKKQFGDTAVEEALIDGSMSAALGAALGASVGAATGAGMADGAALGAAVFGATGATQGAIKGNKGAQPFKREIMSKCLINKGYDVMDAFKFEGQIFVK